MPARLFITPFMQVSKVRHIPAHSCFNACWGNEKPANEVYIGSKETYYRFKRDLILQHMLGH